MLSLSPTLVRIAIIVALLAADGRGVPQHVRADEGGQSVPVAVLSLTTDGCSKVSCCGSGSDCCCSVPLAGEQPSVEPAESCCGGAMDHAALADDESSPGCRCSFSPVSEGPRVPLLPPQTAEVEAVGTVAIMPVAGADGVLTEAGMASRPGDARVPQPTSLLRQLAALCCWRA